MSLLFFWCSVFTCTLFMEKPETTLLRCSLLIEGILGMGEAVVVIIGCDG